MPSEKRQLYNYDKNIEGRLIILDVLSRTMPELPDEFQQFLIANFNGLNRIKVEPH